jgi:renalase
MTDRITQSDVVVVGAGLAGLVCAQQLQRQGFSVVILEKSRGVGGRVDTRRLYDTCVDRGLPYLEVQGDRTRHLIEQLRQHNLIKLWQGDCYQLDGARRWQLLPPVERYIAPGGMTAIAKFLAADLEIWRSYRVTNITPTDEGNWQITSAENENLPFVATKAIVLAIPAPQALMLLQSLSDEFRDRVASVRFDPCFSVTAGYPRALFGELLNHKPAWQEVRLIEDAELAWVAWDSNKRDRSFQPVLLVRSTAPFAQQYLDVSDLKPVKDRLLLRASRLLFPWLDRPEWFQVHRWRYAFPSRFLDISYLATSQPLPLVCCGDWCGGRAIESALESGLAASAAIKLLI